MTNIYKDKILELNYISNSKTLEVVFSNSMNKQTDEVLIDKLKIIIENFQKFLPRYMIINLQKINYLFSPKLQEKILKYIKPYSNPLEINIKCILSKDEFSKISIMQTLDNLKYNFNIHIKYFDNEKEIVNLMQNR